MICCILYYVLDYYIIIFVTLGNFLLVLSCIKCYHNVVAYLVERGVNVNHITSSSIFYSALISPLSAACRSSDIKLATYLIQHKAEITDSVVSQYTEFVLEILKRCTFFIFPVLFCGYPRQPFICCCKL